MTLSSDISDFTPRRFSFGGTERTVLTLGETGPAVIVIHEVYGFTPTLARFCRWVRDAGMRVYAPILLGTPDAKNEEKISPLRIAGLCISREFTILAANRTSPIVGWLRDLARAAHAECGGPGVGAIGLCLTGGFALSMAIDPVVLAPVMGEPSLPATKPALLDISPDDLARVKARTAQGLQVRAYRFAGDTLCQGGRFETLKRELGAAFVDVTLPDESGNPAGMRAQGKPPHSVFTADLIDAPGERTRAAAEEAIAFFKEKLAA